ncbi:unnamed protein product, partial [Urochloa humidicola]
RALVLNGAQGPKSPGKKNRNYLRGCNGAQVERSNRDFCATLPSPAPATSGGEEQPEGEEAMAAATSAAIFAFLAHPLSLLRHVAYACASYLGVKGLKPSTPALLAPATACQQEEENSTAVVQVLSRSTPVEGIGGSGGRHH